MEATNMNVDDIRDEVLSSIIDDMLMSYMHVNGIELYFNGRIREKDAALYFRHLAPGLFRHRFICYVPSDVQIRDYLYSVFRHILK